nr:MAG TPA: hypothetical protein [Caudoviricetes sp.]
MRTLARCFVILCTVAVYATKELISVLVQARALFYLAR